MKLLFSVFACILASAASSCPDLSNFNFQHALCSHDLVIRGIMTSGSSSRSSDGPYNSIHRRDNFTVNAVYKGHLSPDATSAVITYAMNEQDDAGCSSFPYGPGGYEYLIFAHTFSPNNRRVSFVTPCSVNPAWNCVDSDFFESLSCPPSNGPPAV